VVGEQPGVLGRLTQQPGDPYPLRRVRQQFRHHQVLLSGDQPEFRYLDKPPRHGEVPGVTLCLRHAVVAGLLNPVVAVSYRGRRTRQHDQQVVLQRRGEYTLDARRGRFHRDSGGGLQQRQFHFVAEAAHHPYEVTGRFRESGDSPAEHRYDVTEADMVADRIRVPVPAIVRGEE
jgi:hypothetical protein